MPPFESPKLVIGLKGYKVIKDFIEIKVDKTILYGPNGAGKSSVMEILYAVLTGNINKLSLDAIHNDFMIEMIVNGNRYELRREENRYIATT